MKHALLILMLGLSVVIGSARAQGPEDRPAPTPASADQPAASDRPPPQGREPKDKDRPPHDRPRMSEEEAAAALALITRLKPELGEELSTLREQDPPRFHAELQDRFPRYRWLLRLQRYDPEMFELRMQDIEHYRRSRELAEQVRDARQADKPEAEQAARVKLDAVVAEHFAVRQKIREAELARLERRLEELREQLADRAENRAQVMAEHTESLIRGGDGDGDHRGRDDHD